MLIENHRYYVVVERGNTQFIYGPFRDLEKARDWNEDKDNKMTAGMGVVKVICAYEID